jgi:hypothetical protein
MNVSVKSPCSPVASLPSRRICAPSAGVSARASEHPSIKKEAETGLWKRSVSPAVSELEHSYKIKKLPIVKDWAVTANLLDRKSGSTTVKTNTEINLIFLLIRVL